MEEISAPEKEAENAANQFPIIRPSQNLYERLPQIS
jgi:hypothetical protein